MTLLSNSNRIFFDVNNIEHHVAYAIFLRTGRWTFQFHTEWPAVTVPHTIQQKLVDLVLSNEATVKLINEKLASMPPKNLVENYFSKPVVIAAVAV